jgi:hypothetical protein
MTDDHGSETHPPTPDDDGVRRLLKDPQSMAWLDEHATDLRRDASGQRFLYSTLVIGFVVGLLAYVAGYLLRSTATTEPLGLLADLSYTFGLALWTGVVIVVFVQVYPEAKRRQVLRYLDAYEAIRRDRRGPKDRGDVTER